MKLPLLADVQDRVAARAAAIRDAHPFWPCGEGCDHCCRTLPSLPVVTLAEREELRRALSVLSRQERVIVEERIRNAPAVGPLTCPMLDEATSGCRVYDARPVVCRTYGFYTDRDAGLHCHKVTSAVRENGAEQTVVWGNGEAISRDMSVLGEARRIDASICIVDP